MTNSEINIRIAEICGTNKHVGLMKRGLWWRPDSKGYTENVLEAGRYTRAEAERIADSEVSIHEFPPLNYAGCLNACHEMEKTLGYKEHRAFGDDLWNICETFAGDIMDDKWATAHASPLQRCEAFLRVHGKWEETKQETV